MSDRQLPHEHEHGRELERRTKQTFDESVAGIDAATRSRLTQARHRALQELAPARSAWRWPLAPAGALAAVAVAALVFFWRGETGPEPGLEATSLADFEILLGDEELEMLDEELEFYAWLEEQPEFTAPAAGDGVG